MMNFCGTTVIIVQKKDVTLNKTHTFFEFLNSISGVDIKICKMYIQVKKNWVQGNSQGPRNRESFN